MNDQVRRVRFVLKIDVPAILEHRVYNALVQMLRRLPIEQPRVSLSRGEYLESPEGVSAERLAKRRDITPKL